MSLTSTPRPPALLQDFYTRLSQRYGTPGVHLLGFPGRWMAFRTLELAAGIERAVIDVEPPQDHTVEDLAELESRAALAVCEDHDATLAVMHLAQRMPSVSDTQERLSTPMLTLSVWSLEHPMALIGFIELDEAGTPIRISLPDTLSRS